MTHFPSLSNLWTGLRSSFPSPRRTSAAKHPERNTTTIPLKAQLHSYPPNDTLHIHREAMNPANRQYDDVWARIYQTNKAMMDHLASGDTVDLPHQSLAPSPLRRNNAVLNLRELAHGNLRRVNGSLNLRELAHQLHAPNGLRRVNASLNLAKAFLKHPVI